VKEDQKNFILFAVIAALILFGWPLLQNKFFPAANPPVTRIVEGKAQVVPNPTADPAADAPAAVRDRNLVLRETPRIRIDTPTVSGSINLKGARIDDLILKGYKETIAKDSQPIRLLSPSGSPDAYFAGFGWRDDGLKPPAPDAIWTATGDVLSPGKPVTLDAANAQGQRFRIELSVDDGYMFTIRQTVLNAGAAPVPVATYGLVNRNGVFKDPDTWTVQIGPMSVHNGGADYGTNFSTIDEGPQKFSTTGGWLGFTDKYWLTAIVPDQAVPFDGQFRAGANKAYQADYSVTPRLLAPGKAVTQTSRFFAGAKEVRLLDRYTDKEGIAFFDHGIDWGWFRIVEKPIFYYLDWLFRMVGNFGVAIILLTFTIRGLMFPIAQKQFKSMAAMKTLQPKMKALQERYKDDKPRQQQEIMQLYKTEKVNPLAGCLPTLLQIPIFYALYKVLLLTIEMRLRARSGDDPQPVRLPALHPAALPGDRHRAGAARHLDVFSVQAQPRADGRHAKTDLRDHAVGADVRDGAVRGGLAGLLDHLELPDDPPAAPALRAASGNEGSDGQVAPSSSARPSPRPCSGVRRAACYRRAA
jgi:YidC/Oxa1 family membrane protein insertase